MELNKSIIVFIVIINIVFVIGDLCPKQCDCDMDNGMNRALCSDQNIVGIEVGVPKQLQIYVLSHNVIGELDNYVFMRAGYTSLVILDLSNNHIGWVGLHAFSGLANLTNLNLSNNRVGYIPSDLFWPTPQLEILDLSGNIFAKIKNEPFLMHEKLMVLNLKNSKIVTLPLRMFMRLPNLRKLDLSENYMVTMSLDVLKPLKKLERIELHSDYWRCAPGFKETEAWILSQNIVYKKQCNKFSSKMLDKMVLTRINETEVDVADVWNITKVDKNSTKSVNPKNLTPLQKFDSEFPATQAFILGLEIGLAIGILGTFIWLRSLCKCGKLSCTTPETRRQRRRRQRVAENDMNANLLWPNNTYPNVETPPPLRRELSLPDVSVLPTYGLHSFTEASELYDVIRPGRSETPPPPYHELRLQLADQRTNR